MSLWGSFEIISTILGSAGLLSIISALFAFVARLVQQGRDADNGLECSNINSIGYFAEPGKGWWRYVMGPTQTEPHILPTIEWLVSAGEELLYTSSTFDLMDKPYHPERITWSQIYTAIFNDIKRKLKAESLDITDTQVRLQDHIIQDILEKANRDKEDKSELARIRQDLYNSNAIRGPNLINCIKELSIIEDPHASRRNTETEDRREKRSNRSWQKDGLFKPLWIVERKPCIELSREELSALSIILGMPLKLDDGYASTLLKGEGAFATFLTALLGHSNMEWQLHFNIGSRYRRHTPSMGSGYSTLHALFLACGSIPFGRKKGDNGGPNNRRPRMIKCVYVTDEVLQAIQVGKSICDCDDPNLRQIEEIEYLSRLPCSRGDFYYGCYQGAENDQVGRIRDIKHNLLDEPHATWWAAVANIAFGGLVPQATQNVKDAVLFTVTGIGSANLGNHSKDVEELHDCIEALEQLIYALHNEFSKKNKEINLFGDFVAEIHAPQCSTDLVTWDVPCLNTRDAAAIFGRYMTLLEHMSAIFEFNEGQPGFQNGRGNKPKERMKAVYEATCTLLEEVYKQALEPQGVNIKKDLVKKLSDITDRMKDDRHITLDDCATATRCILAAWAEKAIPIHPRLGEERHVLERHNGYININHSLNRIQQEIFTSPSETSALLVAETAQSIEHSEGHQPSPESTLQAQKSAAENSGAVLWYLPGVMAFA